MHGKLRKELKRILKFVQDEAHKQGLEYVKDPDMPAWEFIASDGSRAMLYLQGRRFYTMISSSGSASGNTQVAETLRNLVEKASPQSRSIDLRIGG